MDVISMQARVYRDPMPKNVEESRERHDQILADLNAPIELGRASKTSYDFKTDRYVVNFSASHDAALVLKTTNEVAAFVAEHITKAGYWRGRMEDGALVDVYLIQP